MASYKDILAYYGRYQKQALGSIAAASLFEIIDLVVPYAIGQILNVLAQQPLDALAAGLVTAIAGEVTRTKALAVWMGIVFVTTVVRAPLQPWVGPWFHWAIPLRARRDRTQQAIAKILTLPLEFYDENNPGRIAGRVARGLANHTWTYPEIAGQLIPKTLRVLAIFLAIGVVDWRIATLFLLSFASVLGFTIPRLMHLMTKEEILDKHQENTESHTSEIITNIKTVKAFATEAEELQRQGDRLQRELKTVLYSIHLGYVKLGMFQRTFVQTSVFLVLALTLVATVREQISLGQFVTILTMSSMGFSEIEPISSLAEVFARRYASMLRFHEFLQLPPGEDSQDLCLDPKQGYTRYQFQGQLRFEHLSFGYDPARLVLRDIDLTVPSCQTLALVGRSGSGKSTLVKLLLRYFRPTAGRILMDGQDIQTLDITGYRKRLAIVHQEVDVFNGTLRENLTYGNPQATDAEVKAACEIARVDEFLPLLPQGLNTVVGERGMRLSGGQRQRLGIARALLVNPDVLIFDEATSSLDYESERAIQLAMRKIQGTRTTVIIAHRLSTVREADIIAVLDRGAIAEVGNHEELLERQGLYWRLNALQEGEPALWGG
ncbi:MAG: ABC transporter ATP-binding protein [Pseudanabaenaceae cyanobacterium]